MPKLSSIFKNEKFLYIVSLLPILAITLYLHLGKVEPFETFSLRFNDINFALQEKHISEDVVFVAIDEQSVNQFGRWPWDRSVLAEGIQNLELADVVLLDMIFSEQTDPQKDAIFADAISSLNNSVCGFFLRHNATQKITEEELDILTNSSLDMLQMQVSEHKPKFVYAAHAEMNIPSVLEACTLSGSFSTLTESDHLLRSYPIAVYFQNILYPSLGVQGLRIKFNQDIERIDDHRLKLGEHEINVNQENGFIRLNFYNPSQYEQISYLDVVQGKVKPEYFEGKVVIFGITEVGAGDVKSTPVGYIPGPLLHYTFISNLLEGHLILEPEIITPLLIVLFVLLPLVLNNLFSKILHRAVINIFAYLLVYGVVRYLFVAYNIYIDLFYPLIAVILSVATIEVIAFNIKEKSDKFMKDTFSSYLSGDLLNQLIENPESLKLGGEKKELSILFSDIRGFTTLSESMPAEELIKVLNRYFTPMTQSVLDNGGMLDKYIGDAVMAFFNAPVDLPQHADASCRCALSMIEKLHNLNNELEQEGYQPIHIGIGLNTAEVIVGNIGSDAKKDYTVIGDGVNLASRVEGLTKNYGIEILITEFTVNSLNSDFVYRQIEPVKVKGKDEAVLLYQLLDDSSESKELVEMYEQALAVYKKEDFSHAKELFEKIIDQFDDGVAKYHYENIQKEHPWGVHKMTTK